MFLLFCLQLSFFQMIGTLLNINCHATSLLIHLVQRTCLSLPRALPDPYPGIMKKSRMLLQCLTAAGQSVCPNSSPPLQQSYELHYGCLQEVHVWFLTCAPSQPSSTWLAVWSCTGSLCCDCSESGCLPPPGWALTSLFQPPPPAPVLLLEQRLPGAQSGTGPYCLRRCILFIHLLNFY